ncbi:hypothetical protein BSZ39_03355 [Bowdeniella nasicola]|uniref:Helicase/secretion neighborhood TadE-like protein n=1 Tax=Bowdeniella nasicola TaxID=208480 RepID=A0A1Q5Q444_9ACTO|nr:Rv3654c family TadE-like protein [Bowdeniella nasicola]OKL54577.1 hypothetical protein BSZ39_03355 [Bowdeniella nasicola]
MTTPIPDERRAIADERGSITLIAAATLTMVTLLVATLTTLAAVRAERGRMQAVADVIALSAGPHLADGCERAARIAARNDATLSSCERRGLDLLVTTSAPVLSLGTVSASARAAPQFGPP